MRVMNDVDAYEFDRQGFLVIPALLTAAQVASLAAAVGRLVEHAEGHKALPPRRRSTWGHDYHIDEEVGYQVAEAVSTAGNEGRSLLIEDFWNADPAFDCLVGHAPTLAYIEKVVRVRPTINNSELRVRHQGNQTGTHMGGPTAAKYRYHFGPAGPDCAMVRMIYFVHDVAAGEGEFCVVPGTHKTNLPSPYGQDPAAEPGMIGLPAHAGDAILFTENLRHGGLLNRSTQVRKTLHVGYGPFWMRSQNIATMDEPQLITPTTWQRYTPEQRLLFSTDPERLLDPRVSPLAAVAAPA
jgi:ectoine hydroxylase-related dioxygenase (phytanoyl-CoA dioxygenase family)